MIRYHVISTVFFCKRYRQRNITCALSHELKLLVASPHVYHGRWHFRIMLCNVREGKRSLVVNKRTRREETGITTWSSVNQKWEERQLCRLSQRTTFHWQRLLSKILPTLLVIWLTLLGKVTSVTRVNNLLVLPVQTFLDSHFLLFLWFPLSGGIAKVVFPGFPMSWSSKECNFLLVICCPSVEVLRELLLFVTFCLVTIILSTLQILRR